MTDERELDQLFMLARRYESALTVALRVGDDTVALVASTRLQRALRLAHAAIDSITGRSSLHRNGLMDMFCMSTAGMYAILRRAATCANELDTRRLARWADASRTTLIRRNGPDIFELDAGAASATGLQFAQFVGLHVAASRFIADMRRAIFQHSVVEGGDFTYCRLEDTTWQGTSLHRSFLRDSSFENASFDYVAFFDCDLRNVNFMDTGESRHATCSELQFIRCDLRGANFAGRDLSRVSMIDCAIYGCKFGDNLPPLITRGDLSRRRDGTWVVGVTSQDESCDTSAQESRSPDHCVAP